MATTKPRVTMNEIAKRLNVTVSTVSRAINEPHRISAETRERVMELVRKLNYTPNTSSKNLLTNKTNTFGYLYNRDCPLSERIPAMLIFEALEIAAQNQELHMVFSSVKNSSQGGELPLMVQEKRVQGIFLGGKVDSQLVRKLQQNGIAIVLIANHSLDINVDCVIQDNIKGAYFAVKHLLDHGHRRIGFIGPPMDELWSWERLQGMRLAFNKAGLLLDNELVHTEDMWSPAEGFSKLIKLSSPPTAIFCANDRLARTVINLARNNNISIPDDLSLVGFDNEPWTSESGASLTTVDINPELLAQTAISRMKTIVKKKELEPITKLTPTKLIIRNSTTSRLS